MEYLIDIIAGARPNFVKIAPIVESLDNVISMGGKVKYRLIHTGQHYDAKLSGDFFQELGIPSPDVNFQVGSGSHSYQTGKIMYCYEEILSQRPSKLCMVVGDVNSTMACAIVAKKMNIMVAHVEAGIRSNDLSMPEEINRLVTDAITDIFFTTTKIASQNLLDIGVNEGKVHFVGNTMIDTLKKHYDFFIKPEIFDDLNLIKGSYIVVTLHRPGNVDDVNLLISYLSEIAFNSKNLKIIFPAHPRTSKILKSINLQLPNLHIVEPLSYLKFNYLVKNAMGVITDSGGITEETTVMQIPCMTLRDSTERPETCTIGTNELIGTNSDAIACAMEKMISGNWKRGGIPELWDGNASDRIVDVIMKKYVSLK